MCTLGDAWACNCKSNLISVTTSKLLQTDNIRNKIITSAWFESKNAKKQTHSTRPFHKVNGKQLKMKRCVRLVRTWKKVNPAMKEEGRESC